MKQLDAFLLHDIIQVVNRFPNYTKLNKLEKIIIIAKVYYGMEKQRSGIVVPKNYHIPKVVLDELVDLITDHLTDCQL